MMKNVFCILITFIGFSLLRYAAYGQDTRYSSFNTWENPASVQYKIGEDAYGEVNIPVFDKQIKAMEGKEITVPGYIIPTDGLNGTFQPKHFILSSLPLSACFFCGTGGPESVIEIYADEEVDYTEKPIEMKGTLVLNANDPYQLMYILEDAQLVGEVE